VTAHMMNDELDAGDIVLQRAVPVGPTGHHHRPVPQDARPVRPGHRRRLASSPAGRPTGPSRTAPRPASSTSAPTRTAASTGPGRPRTWTAWSAPSPTRTPTPSPTTGQADPRVGRRCPGRYGGTPGRIFIREGDGVVIVAGAEARTRPQPRPGGRAGPHRGRHRAARDRLLPHHGRLPQGAAAPEGAGRWRPQGDGQESAPGPPSPARGAAGCRPGRSLPAATGARRGTSFAIVLTDVDALRTSPRRPAD
jgi:hypothetical protein